MYIKPGLEPTKSIHVKDCAKMVVDLEYMGEVSSVKYGLNVNHMTRFGGKDKV